MDDRPDWSGKFDSSGGALVPAAPTPDQVISAVERGIPPTPEQQRALLGDATTAAPVPAKVQRDASGNVIRPDWNVPARNESGQFITKSEGELRETWAKESGLAHVAQTVMRKEQTMYSVAPSLQAKVTEHLDKGFLMKAVDHLRLGVSYGPDGFWRSIAQFEDSLTPAERDAWGKFCRSLDEDEQAALLYGMSK
jgi:hypothetical protein